MELVTLALQWSPDTLLSIAMVAIGLGMVIFFHELGHFAVAKWCGVQVERFSIGFGPLLWSRKWGETEYALSAMPLGGYVKMLGQDDLDPGQETSGEIAENPRAYTAKSVPARMAIISAGVIMNVITGFLFYTFAMRMGTEVQGHEVGYCQPGMPAWEAGVRIDDVILAINGRTVSDFSDITRGTALTTGPIRVLGRHADGQEYEVEIQPDESGTKRMIGVSFQSDLKLLPEGKNKENPLVIPGTPAAEASGGFHHDDVIIGVDGHKVKSFAELRQILTDRRGEALTFDLARKEVQNGKTEWVPAQVTVAPQPYRGFGMRMEIGEIVSIQRGSPAAEAGLQKQDRIIKVQGPEDAEALEVGRGIDPARLPDWFADHAGQRVSVVIEREGKGSQTRTMELTPLNRRNWQQASAPKVPLEVPAIGVAFQFLPRVLQVDPGSPADKAGLKPDDLITEAEFLLPEGWPESLASKNVSIPVGAEGWAQVWRMMQTFPTWQVKLTFKPGGKEAERSVTLGSLPQDDWYVASDRGLVLKALMVKQKAQSFGEALAMARHKTRNDMLDIYLTLRGLLSGNISPKELHGPIGIFSVGVEVASAGLSRFLIFLGYLSINLAVLNFLPIPVLDGGHMMFLLWEGVTGRKPNERIYATAMYLGLLFILGLMAWVLYRDVARWFIGG